jgi:hypothetical protein
MIIMAEPSMSTNQTGKRGRLLLMLWKPLIARLPIEIAEAE